MFSKAMLECTVIHDRASNLAVCTVDIGAHGITGQIKDF